MSFDMLTRLLRSMITGSRAEKKNTCFLVSKMASDLGTFDDTSFTKLVDSITIKYVYDCNVLREFEVSF